MEKWWDNEWVKIIGGGALLPLIHWLLKPLRKLAALFRKKFNDSEKIDAIEKRVVYVDDYLLSLVRVLPFPIYVLNIETGYVVDANSEYCELLGFTDKDDANLTKHPTNFTGKIMIAHNLTGIETMYRYKNQIIHNGDKKPIKAIGILEIIS